MVCREPSEGQVPSSLVDEEMFAVAHFILALFCDGRHLLPWSRLLFAASQRPTTESFFPPPWDGMAPHRRVLSEIGNRLRITGPLSENGDLDDEAIDKGRGQRTRAKF
jgi:hypothetical protein